VDALIELLEKDALNVPGITDAAGAVLEDPKDDMFLACACDSAADVIVSGDRHLLQLGSFRGIPVVTVRAFLERFPDAAL
jgi:predicted nucleic acid-binding protein